MNYKHLWKISSVVAPIGIILQGCSVSLVDETGPGLTENPPINLQTFEADVSRRGNVTINGVTVALDGGGTQPLTGTSVDSNGVGLWSGDVSVAACEQLVSYRFTVNYRSGSNRTRTFPDTGSFVQPIAGTDPLCEDVVSASKTFDVNSYEDLPDGNPGDGECSTIVPPGDIGDITGDILGDPPCTLRAAIMESNARVGVDLIRLPSGRYTLTREKTGTPEADNVPNDAWGDLDITDSLAIVGSAGDHIHIGRFMQTHGESYQTGGYLNEVDDKIDRPGSDGLFAKIDGGGIDRVFDVHVGSDGEGFAYFNKIAVLNGHAYDRNGAGIFNQGRLRLKRVAIYDNELSQGQGGTGGVGSNNRGVGISNHGVLVADELAIVNNRVNGTTGFAGGLWVHPGSKATINNSLIALNSARFMGGIYIWEGDNGTPGDLSLTNVTVASNTNTGSVNNAIYNDGKLNMNFVTVVQNNRGGVKTTSSGDTQVRNSLMANNGMQDCDSGTISSYGGNIILDNGCTLGGSAINPDVINPSKSFTADSLTYEGGFTYVVRIRPPYDSSSTILDPTDRISTAIPMPDTDQRGMGFSRAVDADGDGDAQLDPGAYEYTP